MHEWLTAAIQRVRRRPLIAEGHGVAVSHSRPALEQLLPHRPPMLLVDTIDRIDLAGSAVRGTRTLHRDDVGFAGHFPDEAIYPGVLLIETMGQLGITLLHFAGRQTVDIPADTTPPRVRATHIHHAAFLAPTAPDDRLTLYAAVVENNYTMIAAGQVFKGDVLVAYAVAEVFIDD